MGRRGRPSMGFGTGPMLRGGRRTEQKLGPKLREKLLEGMKEEGDGAFAQAAAKLSEVAAIARERGMARVASSLSARAARCCAKGGDQAGMLAATELAIGDARLEADAEHASRTFGDLLVTIDGSSLSNLAPEIEAAIRSALGTAPQRERPKAGAPNRNLQRHLPSECPACGLKITAEELLFDGTGRADCPACSTILVA